jgi:PAS domain S-box-containing protein
MRSASLEGVAPPALGEEPGGGSSRPNICKIVSEPNLCDNSQLLGPPIGANRAWLSQFAEVVRGWRNKGELCNLQATHTSKDDGKSDRGTLRRIATLWRSLPGLLSGIGWRLLVRVLFFSSVITLLLTLMQLYLDYRRDVRAIDLRMSDIDSGYWRSLGEGLWRLDVLQLQLQVEGILRLPDIRYVEVREVTDHAAPLVVSAGSHQANPPARHEFKILYTNRGAEQLLGVLVVEATFDRIYRRLLDTAATIMVAQGIKTFIVSLFILFLVHRLITRHLTAIATSLRGYDFRGSLAPLRLERPLPQPTDELDRLVGAFNQMYARLQVAYGDLEEREAKIRRLVDANIIGILTIDLGGQIIEANDAFLRMVGCEREDLVSGRMRWTDLTPAEWHEADERYDAEIRATGISSPHQKELFKKDGSRVPVLAGAATFDDARGEAVAFVLDLTDLKRAEEVVRESAQRYHDVQMQLAHVNRMTTVGQLSASIAHEINQPLSGILTNASTCLRMLTADPPNVSGAQETARRSIRDANRAADIISRLRALFVKKQVRIDLVDINDASREVISLALRELESSQVILRSEFAEDLPLVKGDRIQLQQVILNLIRNASDAMRDVDDRQRELAIKTAKTEPDGLLVAIQDSGPGIDPTKLDRIFDAFYTTKPDGLGMGLSVCRTIVEAHGGKLWATAAGPHGAIFQFTLPVTGDDPRPSA